MSDSKVVLLYVPCGSEEEAVRLARALLEEQLIACANIIESRSLYWWEGKMADEQEQILLCKTATTRAEAAHRRLLEMHSYDLPCIIRMEPASVSYDYANWVLGEVSHPRSGAGQQERKEG